MKLAARSALFLYKTLFCCAWLVLLFLLVPFLYAFGFCFPRGDDFDEITRAMFLFDLPGAIYEAIREWLTWSGRYTYHFMAVFFAKAAESRILYGIVCALITLLYAIGVYAITRLNPAISRSRALFGAALTLLAIFAAYQYLEVFYLLTDALTSGLQGAAFIIFLAAACHLWEKAAHNAADTIKLYRLSLLTGILAIGVYEHSALAVLWMAIFMVFLSFLADYQERRDNFRVTHVLSILGARTRIFLKLLARLTIGILFSFLAPGNFRRSSSRGVDLDRQLLQLGDLWRDWSGTITDFAFSPWPLFAASLAIVYTCFLKNYCLSKRNTLYAFCGLLVVYTAFSLSLIILHALGDMPFSISMKFAASLEFYTAIAFAAGLCFLIKILPYSLLTKYLMTRRTVITAVSVVLLTAALSQNFQRTAINSVNGQMLMEALFMEKRLTYLKSMAVTSSHTPPFGLLGEIMDPGARSRTPAPALATITVCARLLPVFPIATFQEISDSPGGWPNRWLSHLYRTGGIRALTPQPQEPVNAVLNGNAPELAVDTALSQYGIIHAWRVDSAGQNVTFALNWLIMESSRPLPPLLRILRPNPLASERLAPMWLQEQWLQDMLEESEIEESKKAALAAASLTLETGKHKTGSFYAFPLGMSLPQNTSWPAAIFASFDGNWYHKLVPYIY